MNVTTFKTDANHVDSLSDTIDLAHRNQSGACLPIIGQQDAVFELEDGLNSVCHGPWPVLISPRRLTTEAGANREQLLGVAAEGAVDVLEAEANGQDAHPEER